ncbi:hypothetical protein BV898_03280 [Hypsibius exemplaris]|uniref:Uncharacterized protein n=1 Tax=Hypsibius exemplaris TaxID=2072580 RepID=A0A1W0X613_HYPEX|nr:hypothetical protein BV898_03280 [Hypsibius exemplaris]
MFRCGRISTKNPSNEDRKLSPSQLKARKDAVAQKDFAAMVHGERSTLSFSTRLGMDKIAWVLLGPKRECAGIVNILNGAFMLSSQGSLVSGSLITAGIFMTLAAIALRIGFWDPEKGNFMVAGYGVLCCLSHVIIIGLIIYTFTQGLLDWKAMLRVVDVLLQLICIGFMLTLKGENLAQRSQSQPSEV